jgi:hypothetical protein
MIALRCGGFDQCCGHVCVLLPTSAMPLKKECELPQMKPHVALQAYVHREYEVLGMHTFFYVHNLSAGINT